MILLLAQQLSDPDTQKQQPIPYKTQYSWHVTVMSALLLFELLTFMSHYGILYWLLIYVLFEDLSSFVILHVELKGSCGKDVCQFGLNAVAWGEPHEYFTTFFTTAYGVIFPVYLGPVKSRTDDQGVCLGNDDNEEAPIGCFVIEDTLVNMGVIHQWIILF